MTKSEASQLLEIISNKEHPLTKLLQSATDEEVGYYEQQLVQAADASPQTVSLIVREVTCRNLWERLVGDLKARCEIVLRREP